MIFPSVRDGVVVILWMTALSTMVFAEEAKTEARPPATGRPALLNEAFNALVEDQGRWAYIETHIDSRDGQPPTESAFRIDPSAPYAEQNKPLKIHGKKPTEKQLKEEADRGESAAKRRLDDQQKLPDQPAAEGTSKMHRADEVHLWVNGQTVTPEIDQAKPVAEDETSVTYQVPMHPEGKGNASRILDKFELTARVNKGTHQFERATIQQLASFRVKLIAKVSNTQLQFEFSTPDPRYPAVLTKATATADIALLFGKKHVMNNEVIRTELRHVTPYDERFGVKVGPVRTLEF